MTREFETEKHGQSAPFQTSFGAGDMVGYADGQAGNMLVRPGERSCNFPQKPLCSSSAAVRRP